jgi:predicted acetyltransferase
MHKLLVRSANGENRSPQVNHHHIQGTTHCAIKMIFCNKNQTAYIIAVVTRKYAQAKNVKHEMK